MALRAFEASAERTRQLASRAPLTLREVSGVSADSAQIISVLASVDVMKILCHGQISREDADVALLVSHERRLPPGNTFATLLDGARAHRLGWRELSTLSRSAPVVFLGACSTGKLQVMGLDERITVFASLQEAGTHAVVAPKWKIDVEQALPILDDCLDRYLQGTPLAQSLALAAGAALKRGTPAWIAYAFTLEGSWI